MVTMICLLLAGLVAWLVLLPLGAASANALVNIFPDQELRRFPVAAGVHIYRNTFVGKNPAGYVKPFEPGDLFVGVSQNEIDATADTTDGTHYVICYLGVDVEFALTSVALIDVNKPCFATADNTLSLTGHPDGFAGTIVDVLATNTALVRLKRPGEKPPAGVGSIDIDVDAAAFSGANLDEANTQAYINNLRLDCIGAGLTADASGVLYNEATGELWFLLNSAAEAENITLQSTQVFNITKGITFEWEGRVMTVGAATDDVDCGLMGIAGGITDAIRADMDAATAGLLSVKFHLNANSSGIFLSSDDNSAPVAETSTGQSNNTSVNKRHKLIVRPGGLCEAWLNGVRYLDTINFSVGAAGLLAGIINLEKPTPSTGVPKLAIRKCRFAGALA